MGAGGGSGGYAPVQQSQRFDSPASTPRSVPFSSFSPPFAICCSLADYLLSAFT
jgi:hypothetical protein